MRDLIEVIPESLEKEMATHSNTLAWKIPWMEEPGRLQSMGSQRVRQERASERSIPCSVLRKDVTLSAGVKESPGDLVQLNFQPLCWKEPA